MKWKLWKKTPCFLCVCLTNSSEEYVLSALCTSSEVTTVRERALLLVSGRPWWTNLRQSNMCKTESQESIWIIKLWHNKKKQKSSVPNARWTCNANQMESFSSRLSNRKPHAFALQCWKMYCEHHIWKNRFSEYDRVIISTCHTTYLAICEYKS